MDKPEQPIAALLADVLSDLDDLEVRSTMDPVEVICVCMETVRATFHRAAQASQAEPTQVPEGWVLVSERVPEDDSLAMYIVTDGVAVQAARKRSDCWYLFGPSMGNVTHWMPMPAAPSPSAPEKS